MTVEEAKRSKKSCMVFKVDYEEAYDSVSCFKWKSVCLPKEKGGLGLKDIKTFNLALLGKWKWSLFQHQGELWARVLDSKYGGWRSMVEVTRGTNESIWWRDLKMALHQSQ